MQMKKSLYIRCNSAADLIFHSVYFMRNAICKGCAGYVIMYIINNLYACVLFDRKVVEKIVMGSNDYWNELELCSNNPFPNQAYSKLLSINCFLQQY